MHHKIYEMKLSSEILEESLERSMKMLLGNIHKMYDCYAEEEELDKLDTEKLFYILKSIELIQRINANKK